jgi:hypothetical protein
LGWLGGRLGQLGGGWGPAVWGSSRGRAAGPECAAGGGWRGGGPGRSPASTARAWGPVGYPFPHTHRPADPPTRPLALRDRGQTPQVRGVDIPKPIRTWTQAGLASKVLDVLKKSGFDKPLPIQVRGRE